MQLIYGDTNVSIDSETLKSLLSQAFQKIDCSKVLLLPPDITRFHSKSGEITKILCDILPGNKTIMPTIGTHEPLNDEHKKVMYQDIPPELFKVHDWRNDVIEIGKIPSDMVNHVSEGRLNYEIPIQINKILIEGDYDLIISIGQVVPHENTGFANHNKNIFVGIGGEETINKSHFLAAVYGMERIMGRIDTPVRKIFNYAEDNFLKDIHIIYVMTVIGRNEDNNLVMKGLFVGDNRETFYLSAELSKKVNITKLNEPLQKVVVYLDPIEYQSHWLGNKAIYRTRMALADGAELIVIAPGLKMYGEDAEIDRLIRKYGYHGTDEILREVKENEDLKRNLVASAHLIHGSSEGRFKIIYAPGHLTKDETQNVGYEWADIKDLLSIYDPSNLKDGYNDGFYYISNPALGLWSI